MNRFTDLKEYYTKAIKEWERLLEKAEPDEKEACKKVINDIKYRIGVIDGTKSKEK